MKETLIVNLDAPGQKIDRHIYGHFSEHLGRCIYGGFFVTENSGIPNRNGIRLDVVDALKKIQIPNLRWPGGCFADEYHWMDGIGPKESRPKMINTHWGGVIEDNSFGTHEFMELCELLDCEPYISGNLGSGTIQEMSQWIEYLTFDGESPMTRLRAKNGRKGPWKLRFWGVGNESWGCGGNMTAQFYADQARRYATYCRDFGNNKLYKIACGPSSDDFEWMHTLMKNLVYCPTGCPENRFIQGISLHYYTIRGNWDNKGDALELETDHWDSLIKKAWVMDSILSQHKSIMDSYDPKKKIGLIIDEWGTWHNVEKGTNPGFLYQQNTIRDALIASMHFDMFHKHADRVRMANIAQTINVLQSLILTQDDKMVLTPTYHVFEMNKGHQDAIALPVFALSEEEEEYKTLSYSVSRSSENSWLASISNLSPEKPRFIKMDLRGATIRKIKGRILHSESLNAHNNFDTPDMVSPKDFSDFTLRDSELELELPAHSFITLDLHS